MALLKVYLYYDPFCLLIGMSYFPRVGSYTSMPLMKHLFISLFMTNIYFSVSKCMAKANDYSYIPEIVANPFFGKNSAKDLKEKTGQKDPRMTDMPRV